MQKQKTPRRAGGKAHAHAETVPAPYHQVYPGHTPEEDRLITTLMLAGEALAELSPDRKARPASEAPPSYAQPEGNDRPAILDDFKELLAITQQIQAWIEADPHRAELLERLCEAFGDGDTLRMLFRNLFPDQVRKPPQDGDGKAILSAREVQVLQEAAGDRSHEEIADRLGISLETVHTHFRHIYKKLGVKRPIQAVTRAISMGYLDIGEAELIRQAGGTDQRDFSPFNSWLSWIKGRETVEAALPTRFLSQFALLLLTASGSVALRAGRINSQSSYSCAVVCEVNARGDVVRSFGADYLRDGAYFTFAPPQAARQGFTPGHLFGVHRSALAQGLNETEIVEFTPEGQFVRAFYGGRDLGTRLTATCCPVFASDGRLLVPSTGLTDAILVSVTAARPSGGLRRAAWCKSVWIRQARSMPRNIAVSAALSRSWAPKGSCSVPSAGHGQESATLASPSIRAVRSSSVVSRQAQTSTESLRCMMPAAISYTVFPLLVSVPGQVSFSWIGKTCCVFPAPIPATSKSSQRTARWFGE